MDSQKSLLHRVGPQSLGLQDRLEDPLDLGLQDSPQGLDNLQVRGSLQLLDTHHLVLVGKHLLPLEAGQARAGQGTKTSEVFSDSRQYRLPTF